MTTKECLQTSLLLLVAHNIVTNEEITSVKDGGYEAIEQLLQEKLLTKLNVLKVEDMIV